MAGEGYNFACDICCTGEGAQISQIGEPQLIIVPTDTGSVAAQCCNRCATQLKAEMAAAGVIPLPPPTPPLPKPEPTPPVSIMAALKGQPAPAMAPPVMATPAPTAPRPLFTPRQPQQATNHPTPFEPKQNSDIQQLNQKMDMVITELHNLVKAINVAINGQ